MFVWQVCTGGSWHGCGPQWADYSEPLNTAFETAKRKGKHRRIRYTLCTQFYEIDLVNMTQTNLGFKTERALRRSWVEAGDLLSSRSSLDAQFPEESGGAGRAEDAMEEVTTAIPVLSIETRRQWPQIKY